MCVCVYVRLSVRSMCVSVEYVCVRLSVEYVCVCVCLYVVCVSVCCVGVYRLKRSSVHVSCKQSSV